MYIVNVLLEYLQVANEVGEGECVIRIFTGEY